MQAIYDAHLRRFPLDTGKISFAGFKDLKPWHAIFGDRQTCLCKWCENFLCYQDALRLAATYLAPLLDSGDGAGIAVADDSRDDDGADGDGGTSGGTGESRLAKLVRICQLKSKQMFVNEFICGGSTQNAKERCIKQNCPDCSFQVWWAALKKELVDAYGKLRPGVDKVRLPCASCPAPPALRRTTLALRRLHCATRAVARFVVVVVHRAVALPLHLAGVADKD